MALIITRFTRFGANLGTLHVTEATHVEDLDGTDELTVTCKEDLSKGDYLVWRDQQGNWREHIVDVPERWRDEDGTVYTTALCINSIAETWDDWVDEVRPNGSAQVAMERVLASSRWSAGTCTQTGTAHRTFYHKSVRESLQGIVETWGGELVTEITSDGTKVTGRSAAIVAARGNQSSAKRFTYTKDLLSIHRRVNSDNPKTRIYAYGRGEELDESGAYGRRIGIADVNGGIPYVEDTAATAIWGRYDASGNLMPAIGVFIDEECEDPATLKEEAIAYLQRVKEPSVTYEADVIDLAAFGREWEEIALGDTVTIVDKRFSDEGLRLHGRISRLERDLLDNDTKVTFGTLTDVLAGSWASMREQVGYLTERTAGVENVVNPSSGWLDQLISSLNSQYNAAGTYHYSSFEQGEIWSSVPLDENGHATQSGGWAININGMGFRLASSLNADGSWNWRTFGTGEGFTADEITAGVIRGGQSYWNLNTGDFVISSSSTIGGHAPDDFLTDVDVSVEQTSTGANITVNGDTVTLTNGQDGATGPQGPQGIQGIQGIQGEKGADGTSVTVTSIQYGTSASASTQPSSWSTTVPTSITKGRWLWVKTNYSNNTSAITKSYIGTDGDDGTSVFVQSATKSGDTTTVVIKDSDGNTTTLTIKDGEDGTNGTNGTNGKDGTNGANAYIHTAWANSADGTTDFSTTVSAGKLYLGVYTDNTAADSTSPSAYSWTKIKGEQGEKGDKGDKGDAGTSVTVSNIEYGTSTSASSQPSSWSTSAPSSLTKGSWLWVKTTYSNGDSAITKSYVGTDGTNGSSISVSKTEYQAGTSATTAPTGTWSTSPVTVAQGSYLWTRVTYSDGSKAYSVARQGANGTNGTNGTNGADGTSVTVKSTAYAYQLSTSGTTIPTGTWQTTPQAPTATQYAWTRTTTTFSDNKTAVTYTVGGKTGTSVTVTSIQYGTSDSASTSPSSWSTTVPTSVAKGKWLWVKTNYSDSTSATTKSYVGTDGEDGTSVYVKSSTKSGDTTTIVITDGTNDSTITIKDGEDGENGTNGSNGYVHTAWANSADGTTDFSTTVSAGKTYLGVYTDNTAADSTTPSAYSWSLIKGTGVTSLSPEYYLSTSSTGLAGGSWSAEQQEWQQGHYYWTRQKVTWTDGTTSYTDPVLESALNSANNCALSQHSSGTVINGSGCTIRSLTIHGKSVQDGTPSPSNPIPIQSVEGRNLFDQTAVAGAIRQGTSNASYAYWQDGVLTNVRSVGAHGYWAFDYPMESPVGAGEVLFVSFDVKLSGTNATQQVRVMLQASDSITAFTNNAYVEVAAKDTWEHFAVVRTVASGYSAGDTCYLLIEAGNSGNSVQVRNVCLSASNIGYVPYGSIAARVDGGNYIEVGRDLLTAYYINTAGKKSVDSTGLVSSVNTSSDGRTFAYANSDFFLELPAGSYMFTWFVETASTGSSCQIVIRDSANTYLIGKSSADTFSTGDSLPFTLSEQTKVGIEVKMYSATARFMLTRGTDVPTEYEPYQGSATPIDLDGNALRSLPNGTEDTLEVDGEGNVTINKHTGMSYNELVPMGAGTYYDTDCYQDFSKDFSMYIDFTRVGASRHCFVSAYANIPSLGIELNTGGYVRFYMMGNGVTDRAVGSAVPIGSECRIACMWKASEGRLYWVEEIDGSRTNGTVVPNTAPTGKCTASLRLGGDYRSSTGAGETFTPAWTQVNATPYFEEPFPDDWQSKTWLWGEDGKAVWVDEADTISTTGTMLADSEIVYPLATPQTISLGKIDLPSLPSPSFSMHVDAAVTPTLDAEWWTVDGIASTGQLSQVASDAAERIGGLEDAVSAINNAGYATRAELEATAAELMPKDNDLFKWLRIVDSTLQIGRETTDGNRFYSSYTADGLGFYAGDSTLPVTALTRELGLYAPRSTIDEQLKIGGFAFIKRSNGNLTLKYIGG